MTPTHFVSVDQTCDPQFPDDGIAKGSAKSGTIL
jgi:hypothetical protein